MDHRTRLVPITTTIDGPCALDLANAGGEVFILVFDVPSPKCFAQPGDRHSCQGSNTGSSLEKRKKIQKLLMVVVGVRKKCPVTERSFQRDLQDIVETKSPRA